MNLSAIASIPGVLQACVTDDGGHLLANCGELDPPSAAVLVLGHATLTAAAEMGRRFGAGDCIEIVQQHEGGCVYLHGLPRRCVLIVRCRDDSSISELRNAAMNLSPTNEISVSTTGAFDVSSAMHAEPAW
ncbi:MAG: hypothetical protein R3F13_13020 [Prosthecobacter sp.]